MINNNRSLVLCMYYFIKFNTQTQNIIILTGIVSISYPLELEIYPI